MILHQSKIALLRADALSANAASTTNSWVVRGIWTSVLWWLITVRSPKKLLWGVGRGSVHELKHTFKRVLIKYLQTSCFITRDHRPETSRSSSGGVCSSSVLRFHRIRLIGAIKSWLWTFSQRLLWHQPSNFCCSQLWLRSCLLRPLEELLQTLRLHCSQQNRKLTQNCYKLQKLRSSSKRAVMPRPD